MNDIDKLLLDACRNRFSDSDPNSASRVKLLLDAGANPNAKYPDGYKETALMVSATHGCLPCMKPLIEAGARIEAKDTYGQTALLKASINGHSKALAYLLREGSDINAKDTFGSTSLMLAVRYRKYDCMSVLLKDKSLNIDEKDNNGYTALMIASNYNNEEAVEMLLKAGANPFIKDSDGDTAYNFAENPHMKKIIKTYMDAYSMMPLLEHTYKSKKTKLPLDILKEVYKALK